MRFPMMTTRRWMVAVAVVGLCCGAICYLRRPYPTATLLGPLYAPGSNNGQLFPSAAYQYWSDGWLIRVDETHPGIKTLTQFGPLLRVDWSDESISWYWPGPDPIHKHEKWWDGQQTWHITLGDVLLGIGEHTAGPFPNELPPH